MMDTKDVNEKLIRLPSVLNQVPISRSAWWLGVKDGRFPQPLKLGPRTTVWRLSDIQKLIASLQVRDHC
jgi:prophage regulatory protein